MHQPSKKYHNTPVVIRKILNFNIEIAKQKKLFFFYCLLSVALGNISKFVVHI